VKQVTELVGIGYSASAVLLLEICATAQALCKKKQKKESKNKKIQKTKQSCCSGMDSLAVIS